MNLRFVTTITTTTTNNNNNQNGLQEFQNIYLIWSLSYVFLPERVMTQNTGGYDMSDTRQESAWWRHQMETFSALLALYAGITGEFPVQRQTPSFDVFFDLPEWTIE